MLIVLQLWLPARLIYHYAVANRLRVGLELVESDRHRRVQQISVSCRVRSIDEVPSLLELNRKEESRRGVDAFRFATGIRALWVRRHLCLLRSTLKACVPSAACLDVIDPEIQSCFIRFAIQEVQVLLADKVFGPVQRIQRFSIRRGIEPRIGMQPKLTEASLRRTEDKVRARRRDGIEAIRIDVIEMVITLDVGNC